MAWWTLVCLAATVVAAPSFSTPTPPPSPFAPLTGPSDALVSMPSAPIATTIPFVTATSLPTASATLQSPPASSLRPPSFSTATVSAVLVPESTQDAVVDHSSTSSPQPFSPLCDPMSCQVLLTMGGCVIVVVAMLVCWHVYQRFAFRREREQFQLRESELRSAVEESIITSSRSIRSAITSSSTSVHV
ncbi:hypothetical protein H310_11783 [Aphanomyces invadans]|uniref:Uncharacterized protein n=1 Tax=Aphanomyces invadans TaxID=157072 RepID=A0A024TKE7_9STRA|nr:hypothetical protein H310_11783 [Aphanomyces invadans]ETV94454.1 hypothetical protein H310_11783 [Aphanomyces invadans]|eukprot:XP_008876769.1 hypothetical protein H310_11783 [Aphanomyces invadans]